MSARKNKNNDLAKVGLETAINLLMIFAFVMLTAIFVSRGGMETKYIRLAVMASVAGGCLITVLIMRSDIVAASVVTAVLLAILILGAVIISRGEVQGAAVAKCAACIVAGRFIPFVIKQSGGKKNRRTVVKRHK